MESETIDISMSRADAEILLGVLSAERHNPDVDAVCDALRRQIDAQLEERG